MKSYKDPGFQERVALAADAKRRALEKLKAKPPVDEAVLAERRAAREAKEAAEAEKRAAKIAAREAEVAEKARIAEEKRIAEEERLAAIEAAKPKPMTEAEKKAIRDARYAARKLRK